MAGTVSFLGISSSQNFNTIIDALVSAREQSQITPLQNFENQFSTKITSIHNIDAALSSFYTTLQGMDDLNNFLTMTASPSDTSVLTASANSSATPGSHTVVVGTSIKDRLGSDGKSDENSTIYAAGGTSLQITVGGQNETISFGSDSTLDQMASAINSQSALVSAQVVDDGSTSNRYRLVLTSDTGGSAGNITVSNNSTSANFNLTPAQSVDSTELSAGWSGTGAVTSGGQYLGTTNKTFRFTIGGSGDQTIGTDSFNVTWTDNEGNSGTIPVSDSSYTNLSVSQGVTVSFGSPGQTVKAGDTFSINVWNNTLQAGQDTGIAQAEKEVHSGFSDADTTAVTNGAGTFSYAYNGRQTTVSVAGGTTLTGFMNLINTDPKNPGVTASIINDGTGLSTAYHLVLSGNQTGAAYQITSIDDTTLDNFKGSFSETQSAQNAMINVDGYPPGDVYMQRSSDHITDAIAGVTLDLTNSGKTTIAISADTSAMAQIVSQFVDAFNSVRTAIKNETYYDPSTSSTSAQCGSLLGNYAVQLVQQQLDGLMTNNAPGFQDPNDPYVNLQQVGLSTDVTDGSSTEGLILLDQSTLNAALSSNPNAVADLFACDLKGVTNSTTVTFQSAILTTTPEYLRGPGGYKSGVTHLSTGEVQGPGRFILV